MKLIENDLEFDFSQATSARVFDDEKIHGLSHCMKAVDFLIEHRNQHLFVEVKDPAHPHAKPKDRKEFFTELNNGSLHTKLAYKYRDSLLYERCNGGLTIAPKYIVVIAFPSLTSPALAKHTRQLKERLPVLGPKKQPWRKPLNSGCAVLDLRAWAVQFPEFPVRRVRRS